MRISLKGLFEGRIVNVNGVSWRICRRCASARGFFLDILVFTDLMNESQCLKWFGMLLFCSVLG
jgi:sulfur relay (sulfurtransferase) complex TusBCD TusD component (DsrE family)